jgi:hypothetical protein
MLNQYAMFMGIGAVILGVGLFYGFSIIRILSNYDLERPWILLTVLMLFFFLGYVLVALRFMNIDLLPGLSLEAIVTTIFFGGATFTLVLTLLNRNLLSDVFGIGITNTRALQMFSNHIRIPVRLLTHLINKRFTVKCDNCGQPVKYTIPDIVRSHPRIERGVIVEKGMGGVHYLFYVRHRCGNEFREIPVRHDREFEYRSHGQSRLV